MTHEKKAQLIGAFAVGVMRALFFTLRFRITDHAGLLATPPAKPLVWAFWHNRLLIMGYVFQRYFGSKGRPGAALISQSKDGEVISAIIRRFGIRPIRGSSSRGGARSLVEMKRAVQDGYVMAITPDGPRGPRYRLNPGIVKLAQVAGGLVQPVQVTYSRFWRLSRSWDGFMIPKPFATVDIVFSKTLAVSATADEAEFEAERLRLETLLRPPHGE